MTDAQIFQYIVSGIALLFIVSALISGDEGIRALLLGALSLIAVSLFVALAVWILNRSVWHLYLVLGVGYIVVTACKKTWAYITGGHNERHT